MAESSGTGVEQEIAALEKQLREKKAELGKPAAEPGREVPHDKELLRQVVGQNIQQAVQAQAQTPQPAAPAPASPPPSAGGPSYLDPELQPRVQELVNIAFSRSIQDAIREAVATDNPALIDAFHDVLVDQLYGELVARKKLEQP